MHLIVPFAGTVSAAGQQALHTLSLPHLDRLLSRLSPGAVLGSDEFSPNTPHEQALALALGWPANPQTLPDVALPWAAQRAGELGLLDTGLAQAAWGLLTPVHLQVGAELATLTEPEGLQLDDAQSRELLNIVRPLFETEGFTLHWAGPLQWLATHALFDGLATASLDRVTGRNVDPWLPDHRNSRLLRRLQNEVQMLLHNHAVNDRREAVGLATVNSVWLSGCGRAPAATVAVTAAMTTAPAPGFQVDDRLRAPALAEDWAAWCEAWRALDAGPIQQLLQTGASAQLTLCGERCALPFTAQPQNLWQRAAGLWRKPSIHRVLEGL